MSSRILAVAGVALTAITAGTAAEARTQMRAVGSSTVYPFAKQAKTCKDVNDKLPALNLASLK